MTGFGTESPWFSVLMTAIGSSAACITASVKDLAEVLGRTLVVVAHPDDEALGCGALLQRMREPMVVFCTDGAPRHSRWWEKHQFRERYSELRRNEARVALGNAGVERVEFLRDSNAEPFIDQELFRHLPQAVSALQQVVLRHSPTALLTQAYEGGHPDHDACCFITSVVAERNNIPAWEMPLYRRDVAGNSTRQQFVRITGQELEVSASGAELACKQRMFRAYESQGDIANGFDLAVERLRPLHSYDFTQPPHEGKLNYEIWCWEMTGKDVSSAFSDYLANSKSEGKASA